MVLQADEVVNHATEGTWLERAEHFIVH